MSDPSDFNDSSTDELERLLWERIDGVISAGDSARLSERLGRDPEAAALETEITGVAARLDGVEPEPIPADLAYDIRQGLERVRGGGGSARPWYAGLFGPRPARRLVYLAATLTLAVVGYQLLTAGPARDTGTLTGSAGMTETTTETPAQRLPLPRSLGALTLSRRDGTALIELETSASLEEALLTVTGVDLSVERTSSEGEATFELGTADGEIRLEVAGAGKVRLAVVGSGPLTVTVGKGPETLVTHRF